MNLMIQPNQICLIVKLYNNRPELLPDRNENRYIMVNNKRVLVVSNNCFSPSNSNGRTLGNLFHGWPKENLAQFCLIAKDPAWDVCNNYYCLEDRTMLIAFKHCKKAVGRKLQISLETVEPKTKAIETQRRNIGKKTLPKMMLREMVWAFNRWKSKDLEQWVNSFNPDIVVLQFGDNSFMIDIALYIAQSRKIPLVVYNTEGYYFFEKYWYSHSSTDFFLFPLFKYEYHKRVKRLMDYACHSVYLNDELKEDYDNTFNKQSTVIYNSSSMQMGNPPKFIDGKTKISYLGGLGHGRDLAIIDVGDVLTNIDENLHIDVYGPADEDALKRLSKAKGIEYHGMVSYDKVIAIINESDILFHVEPISDDYNHLKYGFSGKIADSLMSGKCFVLYAPKELACSKYIIKNECGWFAEDKEHLRDVLLRVFNEKQERNQILEKAKQVAMDNHSFQRNAERFQEVLIRACSH